LILVDTDVLIEIFDKNSDKGKEAIRRIEENREDVALTSINLHEILYGLFKYTAESKIRKILLLDVIDFTKKDAALSAQLEVKTEKKGQKIARFDAMIAAVAINRGLELFTFNTKHFQRIEELVLFN
jgi:predicted nucleic acid-binding protein